MTSIHFREVGPLTTLADSAFVTFNIDVKVLLKRALEIVITLNNTELATKTNAALQPHQIEVRYLAHQAVKTYKALTLALSPWDSEFTFDNTQAGRDVFEKAKHLTHRMGGGRGGTQPRPTTTIKPKKSGGKRTGRSKTTIKPAKTSPKTLKLFPDGIDDEDYALYQVARVRGKRQVFVAAAVGAGLYAGGSWLLHHLHVDTLLGLASDEDNSHLQIELGEVEKQLRMEENHLIKLDHSLRALMSFENAILTRELFVEHLKEVESHFNTLRIQVDALIRGLGHLLHHNLHPDLVGYHKLKRGFEALILEVESQGLKTVVDQPGALYTLPVAHMFNASSMSFFVAIGVPLVRENDAMKLFHFMPFPTRVNITGKLQHIVAQPERDFLAVNPLKKTYFELDSGDLMLCEKVGEAHVCPSSGVQLGGTTSCLVNLYKGSPMDIFKTCPHTLASHNFVLQKDKHNFQLYLHEPQLLKVTCDFSEMESAKKFRGIIGCKLPFECRGEIDGYSFEARKPIFGQNIKIKVLDLPYGEEVPDTFREQLKTLELDANKTFGENSRMIHTLATDWEKNRREHQHTQIGVLISLSLILVIIMGCLGFCCWKRGRRNFQRKMRERAQQINVNIDNGQHLAEPQEVEMRPLHPHSRPASQPPVYDRVPPTGPRPGSNMSDQPSYYAGTSGYYGKLPEEPRAPVKQ